METVRALQAPKPQCILQCAPVHNTMHNTIAHAASVLPHDSQSGSYVCFCT